MKRRSSPCAFSDSDILIDCNPPSFGGGFFLSSRSISTLSDSRRRGFFVCRRVVWLGGFFISIFPLRRVLRGSCEQPEKRSQTWQKRKRRKERKEAKERKGKRKERKVKRKQDGGLFINPHSNTARAREGAHGRAAAPGRLQARRRVPRGRRGGAAPDLLPQGQVPARGGSGARQSA